MKKSALFANVSILLFVVMTVWWVILAFVFHSQLVQENLYWAAAYQLIAIWGGIFGLIISKSWGGYKSLMGRVIVFFSIGLLFQAFGQTVFSYYTTILGVPIPYPSLADVGYFGGIIFYILGIASLAKVAGVMVRLRTSLGKLEAFLMLAVILGISYAIFLNGYVFDWTSPLTVFLDFGYPLGQAIYVSLAILTLILSRNVLGGSMRGPLVLLMAALIAQYCADFNFLYQAANSTWVNGGYGDFFYTTAYFLMALSLAHIERTLEQYQSGSISKT